MEPLKLPIKPTFDVADFARANDRMVKALAQDERAVEQLNKGFMRLGTSAHRSVAEISRVGTGFRGAFDTTLRGIDRINSGFDRIASKILNVRTLVTATFAGAAFTRLFRLGLEGRQSQARLEREFGGEAAGLEKLVQSVSRRAGRDDDSVREGVREIARAMDPIRAGRFYQGAAFGDKYAKGGILSAADADALRQRNIENTVKLFERAATVIRDVDPSELGKQLADAAGGIEGATRFAKFIGLQRSAFSPIIEAADKGKLYDVLTEQERKQFGVTKGQGFMGGQLAEILLSKARVTDKTAEDVRKTPEFELSSARLAVSRRLQNVGEKLVEQLAKLTGGKLAAGVEGALSFAGNNMGLIGGGVGALGLLRLIGRFRGGGLAGGFAGGITGAIGGGAGGVTPVFVTNMDGGMGGAVLAKAGGQLASVAGKLGAIGAALGIGVAAGTWLDNKLGISDNLSGTGVNSRVKADMEGYEGTRGARGQRILSLARNLAGRVKAGTLTSDEALSRFEGTRKLIEGRNVSGLSTWAMDQLKRGNVDAIAGADKKLQAMNVNIGNIALPMADSPEKMVSIMLPEIERQMVHAIKTNTGNYSAPASRE